MFYIIYKITNKINGKIYIGKHQTSNIDDTYMGSGKLICAAIRKYNVENFDKEVIHVFDNEAQMNAKEAELVTDEFVLLDTNYNLCPGGNGGFGFINKNGLQGYKNKEHANKGRALRNRTLFDQYGENFHSEFSKAHRETAIKTYRARLSNEPEFNERLRNVARQKQKLMNSEAAIIKKKETFKSTGHSQGIKNSQFGTCWITDGRINKKVRRDEVDQFLNDEFRLGRTIL